ncbi:tail fiber protein [Massilia aurea]|uniref:phage tail protein n=1 Tax=Massilia aurea TaxID=373040 RepID=UPI00346310D7
MSDPYIGEIRMFGGNFAPEGWLKCEGQLLPIAEYDTLFNLIGTTYGGDGQETFAVPDLRGRVPIHFGSGPGLSSRELAAQGGVETVTLTTTQMPAHSHAIAASHDRATTNATGAGSVPGNTSGMNVYGLMGVPGPMATGAIAQAGGADAHENMAPYLCVNFIISLYGIFPSQY